MSVNTNTEDNMKGFDWIVTKRLGGYLKPYKHNLIVASAAMLLSVFANIMGPPIVGYAVDEGMRNRDLNVVILGVVGYLVIQGLGLIGFRVQISSMATAGQRVIQQLRDELFEHIQYLSVSFFASYETGRLIARVISDVNTLREAITFAIVGSLRDTLILVGIIVSMALINLPLTGVSLITILVLGLIANFWRIHARKAYNRVVETNARVNAELSEAFTGVRVTQAFDRQDYNYQQFAEGINLNNRQAFLRAALVASLFFPTIELVGGVATGALIFVGGELVLQDQLSVGVLLTFVLYIGQFFFPIRMLAQRYNLFQSVMAAGDKVFYLMDRPIEIADSENALELPQINGHVQFDGVHFKYSENGERVLTDINLEIPAGKTVALVGHTGAGKSTIVKLVMRFHDVTQGSLKIDGYDVREVSQNSLRRQMGVVLQETHLFSGTVMDNIRYGSLDASDEDVISAAKAVGAHEFISKLDNGYETEIQEGGSVLSSGQRQLLSFARALLANPRILILDEATSNIDTQTEKIIQTGLERLLKGRTSFVIAHRLSTITAADMIVVMDHGEVIEVGTHQELLELGGMYHRLYTML